MQNQTLSVIRGIALTPPLLGRITMGHTEVRGSGDNAKSVPKKDDHFTITTLSQKDDRSWEVHPIQSTLVKGKEKLLRIPVRIAYNDPNITLNNSYSCFDPKRGGVLCTGNGETARRITDEGVKQIACRRPEGCEYAQKNRCKNMTRAYFQIDGQEDDLGVFALRSTSWNTLTSLAGRLMRLHGLSGGKLAGMPLVLELKTKTTAQSFRKPIFYADLTFRPGKTLIQTIQAAREYQKMLSDADLQLEEMENAVRLGIANGDFADEIEDVDEWVSDEELVTLAGGEVRQSAGLKGLDALLGQLAAAGATPATAPVGAGAPAVAVVPPAAAAPVVAAVQAAAAPTPPVTSVAALPSLPAPAGSAPVVAQATDDEPAATMLVTEELPLLPPKIPFGGPMLALALALPPIASRDPSVPVMR